MKLSRQQLQIVRQVNVLRYSSFRDYLKDVYLELKKGSPLFSFRNFSRMAGFSSPNFIKLVIESRRNLSAASVDRLTTALSLPKKERTFFRQLVLFDQAQTASEKQFYADQIVHFKPSRQFHPLRADQYEYYSRWYLVPIRELAGKQGFKEDPEWIAQSLTPPISAQEAKQALRILEGLGLLVRDEHKRLIQGPTTLSTGDQVLHTAVVQFHKEMILKGSEAIERFPAPERDISALTLLLSTSKALAVRELIQKFRKKLLEIELDPDPQDSADVFQVNFQFFPLTQTRSLKDEP